MRYLVLIFILFFLCAACKQSKPQAHLAVQFKVESIPLYLTMLKGGDIESYEKNQLRTLEVVGVPIGNRSLEIGGVLFYPYEYPLPKDSAELKKYHPIGIAFDLKEKKFFPKDYLAGVSLEHPRQSNFFDLDQDGLIDLIISDHGHDEEPFAGGEVSVYFQESDHTFKRHPINLPRGYWFSSCSKKIDSDRTLSMLVSTGTEAGTHPTSPILLEVKRDRTVRVIEIAETKKRHYLSCAFSKAREQEVFLGPMDGQKGLSGALDERFTFSPDYKSWSRLSLASKGSDEARGTIEMKAMDIDGDSKEELTTNSHDHKLSRGLIEVLKQEGPDFLLWKIFDPLKSKVVPAKDYFIPRFHWVDLDQNGLVDLLFSTGQTGPEFDSRAKSTIHLYLQVAPGEFQDVSDRLPNNRDLLGLLPLSFTEGEKSQPGILYVLGPRVYELYTLRISAN